jgi:AraC-like DNA-binding protein
MRHNLGTAAPPGFRNPAHPAGPVVRRRYQGSVVAIYEWRCGAHRHAEPIDEWSDAHEVVVPRRGAFLFRVEGRGVFADPASAAFLHPGDVYRVHHPLPGGDSGSVFRLGPGGAAALIAEHDPAAADRQRVRFPAAGSPLDGRGYLLHRQAIRALDHPATTLLELEERAIAFVREAVAQAYVRRPESRNRRAGEYARRVREVLAARYREPLTLADVARAVEASPFHLSRLVAAATGVPIHRLIVRLRLRDALERLLETRESISAVALAAGFASHSHLTDAFRREYGMPPSAVRRSWRVSPRSR